MTQNNSEPRRQTQWAAQFAVASELCKRNYCVAFTMGNATPVADLMVWNHSTNSKFVVDVKGLAAPNFWQVKKKAVTPGLFYILALVPQLGSNRYFVLTQSEMDGELDLYKSSGVKTEHGRLGLNWGAASKYESQWEHLP